MTKEDLVVRVWNYAHVLSDEDVTGGSPALLHVRERSGIMACRGAAGGGVATHDKGYYHSYISRPSCPTTRH